MQSEKNEEYERDTKASEGAGAHLRGDVQGARLSGHKEMKQIENARTNSSDGSLAHYVSGKSLPDDWSSQNESLVLEDGEVSVSRTKPVRESDLPSSKRQTSSLAAVDSDALNINRDGISCSDSRVSQLLAYDLKDAKRDAGAILKKAATFSERTGAQIGDSDMRAIESPASIDLLHPHLGQEDKYVSYGTCRAANMRFDELRLRIGSGPGRLDADLIAAVIRHEQEAYKQFYDTGQDSYVQKHPHGDGLDPTISIGPAQMQIRHINRLVQQFPSQLGHYTNDPLRAAQNPGDAPYFVAGYFADVIQHLERNTRPEFIGGADWADIRKLYLGGDLNDALIKSFNPHPRQIEFVMKNLKLIHEKHLK